MMWLLFKRALGDIFVLTLFTLAIVGLVKLVTSL